MQCSCPCYACSCFCGAPLAQNGTIAHKSAMEIDTNYPSLDDLRRRARRRIPHFAWEYLESGTGAERALSANREALDQVRLRPAILAGEIHANLETSLLSQSFSAPFGMSPVGMSGLFWPGAEISLAKLARAQNIPYSLSTVAAQAPEDLAPHIGENGWFQLYSPANPASRADLLARAKAAGFKTLILTVDVPGPSRRERQRRGGVATPPKITPRILSHVARRPAWALATLRHGMPKVKTLAPYAVTKVRDVAKGHVGLGQHMAPDWDFLAQLRKQWDGPILAKGVLNAPDALRLLNEGVDGVWVSNHGGRQFDASPSGAAALPAIRAAVGPDYPLLYDGAIGSGLDVLRAIALGADFVMLGRAWHHGLGAFGAPGAAHVDHILRDDMKSCMMQMGITRPVQARDCLWT